MGLPANRNLIGHDCALVANIKVIKAFELAAAARVRAAIYSFMLCKSGRASYEKPRPVTPDGAIHSFDLRPLWPHPASGRATGRSMRQRIGPELEVHRHGLHPLTAFL